MNTRNSLVMNELSREAQQFVAEKAWKQWKAKPVPARDAEDDANTELDTAEEHSFRLMEMTLALTGTCCCSTSLHLISTGLKKRTRRASSHARSRGRDAMSGTGEVLQGHRESGTENSSCGSAVLFVVS